MKNFQTGMKGTFCCYKNNVSSIIRTRNSYIFWYGYSGVICILKAQFSVFSACCVSYKHGKSKESWLISLIFFFNQTFIHSLKSNSNIYKNAFSIFENNGTERISTKMRLQIKHDFHMFTYRTYVVYNVLFNFQNY